jgi:hypothetical protein
LVVEVEVHIAVHLKQEQMVGLVVVADHKVLVDQVLLDKEIMVEVVALEMLLQVAEVLEA